MAIWDTLQGLIDEARQRTLGAALEAYAGRKAKRAEEAFSIALIALSAKMAKADGEASDAEAAAFRRFFQYPASEEPKVRMVYNLAKEDVAGFEHYLAKVSVLFAERPIVLEDVLDCLFYVATADGLEHPRERVLLDRAAAAFGISPAAFRRIRAAHFGLEADDPFAILGVEPEAGLEGVKAAWRALARDHHPDALMARGVPAPMVKIAEARMAAINAAYKKALELAKS
jgi:DnaJ like chaperone protein